MITEEYAWDRFVPTPHWAPKPVQLVDAPSASTELAVVERNPGVVAQPECSADVVVLDRVFSVPEPSIERGTRDQRPLSADNEAHAPSPTPSSRLEVSPGGSINMVTDDRPVRTSVAEVTGDTFYVDLNAIAEAVKEAQANAGQPVDDSKRIYVGKEGELLQGNEVTGTERVAEVTGDTFYVDRNAIAEAVKEAQANVGQPVDDSNRIYVSKEVEVPQGNEVSGYVDLEAIAKAVKEAQAWPTEGSHTCPPDPRWSTASQPDRTSTAIYVTKEGELRSATGELLLDHATTRGDRVADVTGDTFYATRLEDETEFVRTHMPANTRWTSDGTFDGWYFAITNEFGDTYGLFMYYHKGMGVYRVALVEPRLEGKSDAHGGHLWADGHLCLTRRDGSGYKSIETTYAKAALWTRGMSCYRRGYGFQFNIGQD